MTCDCPASETLELLLAEALEPDQTRTIELHVETCALCQQRLRDLTLSGGPAPAALAKALAMPGSGSNDPKVEGFFDRLKLIDPPAHRSGSPDIPGYEVLNELGRGATGVVYRARHIKLNRLVALKIIHAGPHLSAETRRRFRAEAMTIANLRHNNIVQIYDVGEHAQLPFLSLELVEGGNLSTLLTGKPRDSTEAAQIIATLAETVAYAHNNHVIHRDLKPGNVLLGRSSDAPGGYEIKITDFGIAKVLPNPGINETQLTQTGEILGTPAYMAPEQARGSRHDIGAATDVYSLGAILYELLAGHPPFQGATALDTLMQAAHQEPISISRLVPRVPKDLDTICLKCLEKDPARRYPSGGELADDLNRFLRHEPIAARPISWAGHLHRWTQRHRLVAALLAGLLCALMLIVTGSLVLARQKIRLAEQSDVARRDALESAQRESALRTQAESASSQLRQTLYFDQMNLGAQAAVSPSGIGRVAEWLAPWAQSRPDLRGWEWYYLNSLCHRESMTLTGHFNGIRSIAWNPDGRFLASGGSDNIVRIWDAATGNDIRSLPGHEREVAGVAWSPDGRRLASGSFDGRIKIWDVAGGNEPMTLDGNSAEVYAVAWSPDGSRIASAGSDQTVRIWNSTTGRAGQIIRGANAGLRALAWSHDGTRVAFGGEDALVHIWNLAGNREIGTLRGHVNFINSIAWSRDDSKLATASNDQTIRLWNAADRSEIATLHGHDMGVTSIAWSPDGNFLASGSDDQTIKIWRADGSPALYTIRGHTKPVTSVNWSPDGKRLASSSFDTTTKIWAFPTNPEVLSLSGHADDTTAVSWSPDSTHVVSASLDKTIRTWNLASGQQERVLQTHPDPALAAVWSPDGKAIASASSDGTIRISNALTGAPIHVLNAKERVTSLAWSPDSRWLVSGGSTVLIWDSTTGTELRRFARHDGIVECVAWNPDSKRIAAACDDRTIRIWDVATGRQLQALTGHIAEITSIAFSPNGSHIASVANDQMIKVWDTTTGQNILNMHGHTTRITAVAWNPDGSRLATASEDHTIKLWDAASGNMTMTLNCDTAVVHALAWSPDGMKLAAAGTDHLVRVYDATPGYITARSEKYLPILDQSLRADPNDAAGWNLRAKIDANREDWDAAAADLKHVLALNSSQHWAALGYWVIGTFPADFDAAYPPEQDSDPSHVLRIASSASAPLTWQAVPLSARGFINFGEIFDHAPHCSAYSQLRIFSPRWQNIAILAGADDQMKLWLNGRLILIKRQPGNAVPDDCTAVAELQPGWNILLSRVINITGEHAMYLRISQNAAELAPANSAR